MTAPPEVGSVVLWWDDDALLCGAVVGAEKHRALVVTPAGREERIAPARIASVVARRPDLGRDPAGAARAREAAASAEALLARRSREVDVATMWDLVRDRTAAVTEAELAGIALEADGEVERAAVLLALRGDGVRFVRRPGGWLPRSAEQVEEILEARETETRKARERSETIAALGAAASGGPYASPGHETERRIVDALWQLAVLDADAGDKDRATALEVLDAAGLPGDRPAERAFRLLRRIGRFASDDENLSIARYALPTAFSEEALREAGAAVARGFDRAGRRDLTGLPALTIDAAWTTEVDDALTIAPRSAGGCEIGVHIADPGVYVPVGGAVDAEAQARGTTYYFPERKLLMLPPAIGEEAASLTVGADRPTLSFLVTVDASGRVVASEIARSVVRVAERLDFDEADARIASGRGAHAEALSLLARLAASREELRRAAGALMLRTEEIEVRLEGGRDLVLVRRDQNALGQRLVQEAMVLAGEVAARWLLERGAAAIFRRQAAPDLRRADVDPALPAAVRVRATRRALKRGETALAPAPHHGLGLDAYVQVTSPLRRYQDLVLHRQIASLLERGTAEYDAPRMRVVLAATERAEVEARRAERAASRYWMLRWLERFVGSTLTGVVVEVAPRPVVTLDATLTDEAVPALAGAALGDRVRLRVERVNPRADLVVLRPG